MFFFRLATREEVGFYNGVVYAVQDTFLKVFSERLGDIFRLTGGTALSRFYLKHRLSEDLDLFTESTDLFTKGQIDRLLALVGEDLKRFELDMRVEGRGPLYTRLSVKHGNLSLRIDLSVDKFLSDPVRTQEGFLIDSLENIAVNKLIAFEDRAEIKDLMDMLFLEREGFSLDRLLELADEKGVSVPHEELFTINQHGLTGFALLLKDVSGQELEEFLERIKQKLSENIKKKVSQIEAERLVRLLLWDAPPEERKVSPLSLPLLKRRAEKLSLPNRIALERYISSFLA